MYNERNDSFSIKDMIIQILFIVLFVFILIWLFPTKNSLKGKLDKIDEVNTKFDVLTNRIFNDNLQTMKEAAIAYYTTPRLPKNVNDVKSMTLREMLKEKLLIEFKDANNKSCKLDDSYVEITKLEDEYLLKVSLTCTDNDAYILVHLGCYNYCNSDICENKSKPASQPILNKPVNNKPTTPTNPTPSYKCKYVNGKYYGKDGNVVSKDTYTKECTTPAPSYKCEYVNGKYYGKDGNVVSKDTYTKECTPTTPVTPINPITPDPVCIYKYEKTVTEQKWSNWSNWSTNVISATSTRKVEKKTETKTETKTEIKDVLKAYKKTTTTTPKTENVQVQVSTVNTSYCNAYTSQYTSTGQKKYEWINQGTSYYNTHPKPDTNTKYEYVGSTTIDCKDCYNGVLYIYRKYTLKVYDVVSKDSVCSSYGTMSTPIYITVPKIIGYNQKVTYTPIYEKQTVTTPVTKTTEYYRYKTLSTKQNILTKWSSNKNDKTLINDGYKYVSSVCN